MKTRFKSAVEIIQQYKKKAAKKQLKVYFIQYRYKPHVYENILFTDPYFTSKMPTDNGWKRHKGYAHMHSLRQAMDKIIHDKQSYKARYYEFRVEAFGSTYKIK